eukprot:371725-Prorocentrum_minimum.AAC.1
MRKLFCKYCKWDNKCRQPPSPHSWSRPPWPGPALPPAAPAPPSPPPHSWSRPPWPGPALPPVAPAPPPPPPHSWSRPPWP